MLHSLVLLFLTFVTTFGTEPRLSVFRQLTLDEIAGWYPDDIDKSTKSLVTDSALCTYLPKDDPFELTRRDEKGMRYFDYYGCNYCNDRNEYIESGDDCDNRIYNSSSPLCNSKLENYPPDYGDPFGDGRTGGEPTFDRKKNNWFAMVPTGDPLFEFGDYRDRNFTHALIKMAKFNKALVWIGDSVTRYSFVSTFCDIKRTLGKNVTILKDVDLGPGSFADQNLSYDDGSASGKTVIKYSIFLPSDLGEGGGGGGGGGSGPMQRMEVYFLPYQSISHGFEHLKKKLKLLLNKFSGLVIVANTGLWTNNPSGYRKDLSPFLHLLNTLASGNHNIEHIKYEEKEEKDEKEGGHNETHTTISESSHTKKQNLVFFRETTCQHFNSELGYFQGSLFRDCKPSVFESSLPNIDPREWRNKIVVEIMHARNFSSINIIPFWRYTVPLWDFHKGIDLTKRRSSLSDCTHFGFTILLMQPILRPIAYHVLKAEWND